MNPQMLLSMPQTRGLMSLPADALTGDIRRFLMSQPGGPGSGALTGAGLPGLTSPLGYQALQRLAGYGGGQQQIALTLSQPAFGLAQGAQIMLALHPSDVHVAEEIDTYLAGYSPPEFRADEACPIVPVRQLTDQFRTFTSNNAFRVVNVYASAQSDINEVDPETVLTTYHCVDRALGGFVPTVTEYTATKAFDPRQALARRIRWGLSLERELRIFGPAGLLTTTTNWASGNRITIAGGSEWDTSSGDPIADMHHAEEASVMPITDWWFPTPTFNAFLRNPNVRNSMRQLLGDNAPSPDVAQRKRDILIPGLAPIHKVEGKYLNPSTGNIEFIMPDKAVGTHVPTGGMINPEDIQTAVTWRFDGPSGVGFITREFDLPRRGLYAGTMMVSGYSEDPRFIANNVGAIISNTESTR